MINHSVSDCVSSFNLQSVSPSCKWTLIVNDWFQFRHLKRRERQQFLVSKTRKTDQRVFHSKTERLKMWTGGKCDALLTQGDTLLKMATWFSTLRYRPGWVLWRNTDAVVTQGDVLLQMATRWTTSCCTGWMIGMRWQEWKTSRCRSSQCRTTRLSTKLKRSSQVN